MTRRRTHQRKLHYPSTTSICVYGHVLYSLTRTTHGQCRACLAAYASAWWDAHPVARRLNDRRLPANLPPLTAEWLLS